MRAFTRPPTREKKLVRNQRFGMAMSAGEFKLLTRLAKQKKLSKTELIITLLNREGKVNEQ